MTKQKWRKKLEARFGRMPQEAIEDSEIDILRGYFDHRRKAEPTVFHIDETPGRISRWTRCTGGSTTP